MRALVIAMIVATTTAAYADEPGERNFCPSRARYRGARMDLDVKLADIHDVFRLLGDTGRINIVVPDTVRARVTLRLVRVPWDQVACTVAAMYQLTITANGNVLVVAARPAARN